MSAISNGSRKKQEGSMAHATPSEVVMALTGRQAVDLGGFVHERSPTSWVRLDRQFASADGSVALTEMLEAKRNGARRVMQILAALVVAAAIAALGALIGSRAQAPYEVDKAAPTVLPWSVKQIVPDGLVVELNGVLVRYRINDTLPNGEVLRTSLPMQGAYITNLSTVAPTGLAPATRADIATTPRTP
jgi:hypothetical protein